MKTGIVLMWLIVLLLLAAVLPIAGARSAAALYHSPVMILLLGLLAGSCVWCCRRKRSGWQLIGFLLIHLGIVIVLAGGMLGFLLSMRAMARMPIHVETPIDTVMVGNQRQVPLGFTLVVIDGETRSEIPVAVNKPANYGGWIFYLMSYDAQACSYIDISARRDPGRGAVIAGIWMIIAGVFILSFRRTGEAADATC